ncbi:MAG: hypothetical protein JSR71_04900 [Proteobacteria bacterium]|nr:hypothetical protein [Pseudomonadota bacterium]
MNPSARLNPGFIKQQQQRLAVMAIGSRVSTASTRPLLSTSVMLLIAKHRLAVLLNPARLGIYTRLGNFNDAHSRLSI